MTASIGMAIVAELGIGGHERIVYEETTTKGQREISMNAATGGLEYVYEKGADGSSRVVVFGDKAPVVPGVQVVKFSDLQANEQDQVLASLPAMDSRDPALITQQLVALQEALTSAMAMKMWEGLGIGVTVEGNKMYFGAEGLAGLETALDLESGAKVVGFEVKRVDEAGAFHGLFLVSNGGVTSSKPGVLARGGTQAAETLAGTDVASDSLVIGILTTEGYSVRVRLMDGQINSLPTPVPKSALSEAKNLGEFGGEPRIAERVAETAVEGTKKAVESIPGGEAIMKTLTPRSKESKPARPTEKLDEKPAKKSLFEQMMPFFEKAPGSPLPMPRGLNPLKVNGDALGELYASAKDALGAWDFDFMRVPDDETVVDQKPITVASANVQPADAQIGALAVKPTAVVAPAKTAEPEPTAAKVNPAQATETKPLETAAKVETPEKKGFFARIKETVASYKEDVKTVVSFVKDETVAFCEDTVEVLVDAKDAAVDIGRDVVAKAQDVSLTVGNFEYGLKKGLIGKSPVALSYDREKGDWYRSDANDPSYLDYEGPRNVGYEIGDYAHDRAKDFTRIFKVVLALGPGAEGGFKVGEVEVKGGFSGGWKAGFEDGDFFVKAEAKVSAGVKAGKFELKPSLKVSEDLLNGGSQKIETDPGIKIGGIKVKKDLSLETEVKGYLTKDEIYAEGKGKLGSLEGKGHAGLVGGEFGIKIFQIADFFTGFFGADLMENDEKGAVFGGPMPYRHYLIDGNNKPVSVNVYEEPSTASRLLVNVWDGADAAMYRAWEGTKTIAGATKDLAIQTTDRAMDATHRWAVTIVQTGSSVKNVVENATVEAMQWTANITQSAAANAKSYVIGYPEDAKMVVGYIGEKSSVTYDTILMKYGGEVKEEPIAGYDRVVAPSFAGQGELDFYTAKIPAKSGNAPSGVFEMRHSYRVPIGLGITPFSPPIKMEKGDSASKVSLMFNGTPADFKSWIAASKTLDLFFHGYNVGSKTSLKMRTRFVESLDGVGYDKINLMVSWSGDVGNNKLSKLAYFRRAERSADMSWQGLQPLERFVRAHNPDIKINATTHSLGARLLLDAAASGMKFGNVVLFVPAVDNEDISVGGRYEKAIQNIDHLTVIYSTRQEVVFGLSYRLTQFDRALGAVGPSGPVHHPDFKAIDATDAWRNRYGLEINSHSDIYEPVSVEVLRRQMILDKNR